MDHQQVHNLLYFTAIASIFLSGFVIGVGISAWSVIGMIHEDKLSEASLVSLQYQGKRRTFTNATNYKEALDIMMHLVFAKILGKDSGMVLRSWKRSRLIFIVSVIFILMVVIISILVHLHINPLYPAPPIM